MPLIPIESLNDPRVDVYRDVKAPRHSRWAGRFVAEGKRLVKRLLVSDYVVESVLLSAGHVDDFSPWLPPEVSAFVMPRPLAAELVGYNFHCGAMACAIRKPSPRLEDVMARCDARSTFIVCPDVNDPENIGTLIRLGAAFGVDAVFLGPACADPFSRRVLRVSMGNALTLPIVQSLDLRADLRRLKIEWDVQLAATVVENSDPTDDDQPLTGETFAHARRGNDVLESLAGAARPARLALLFGNEAHGLRSEWLELCDRRLTIPMHDADSLNVAVAAGIFLYHFTSATHP
ncbi:MAG TPA: RNA methyltransferase [Planctomycetaceae bacterium]|nr:RNA methyltransferase [Planctomycetaceae bacterium]